MKAAGALSAAIRFTALPIVRIRFTPAQSQEHRIHLPAVSQTNCRSKGWFADSLLEGGGFELLVPRHESRGFPDTRVARPNLCGPQCWRRPARHCKTSPPPTWFGIQGLGHKHRRDQPYSSAPNPPGTAGRCGIRRPSILRPLARTFQRHLTPVSGCACRRGRALRSHAAREDLDVQPPCGQRTRPEDRRRRVL